MIIPFIPVVVCSFKNFLYSIRKSSHKKVFHSRQVIQNVVAHPKVFKCNIERKKKQSKTEIDEGMWLNIKKFKKKSDNKPVFFRDRN